MVSTSIVLERLEKELEEGKVTRKEVDRLKGGMGKAIIYTDTIPHCDSRVHESGKIVLEERATIGCHLHNDDEETITVLCGLIESNGNVYPPGAKVVCPKGETHHTANLAEGESVLRFVKRK